MRLPGISPENIAGVPEMNLALGYMGYKDQGKQLGNPVTLKGSTFGAVWNIGYDFAISGNWAAGIQLSFLSGMLTECDLTENGVARKIELEKDEYEGLGRMNISVGLRCNL